MICFISQMITRGDQNLIGKKIYGSQSTHFLVGFSRYDVDTSDLGKVTLVQSGTARRKTDELARRNCDDMHEATR